MRKMVVFIGLIGFVFSLNANKRLDEVFKNEVECWPEFRDVHDEKTTSQVFKDAYDITKKLQNFRQKARIEKIIHFIWLSDSIPSEYIRLIDIWKQCHPEFKFMLWTERDIENLELVGRYDYKHTSNFLIRLKILKLELLYQYGGVCIDINSECIFPLDIFHHTTDFYACFCHQDDDLQEEVGTFVMGAKKNHPLIKSLLNTTHLINIKKGNRRRRKVAIDISDRRFYPEVIKAYFEKEMQKNESFTCVVLPKPFFNFVEQESEKFKAPPFCEIEMVAYIYPYTYSFSGLASK